MDPLQLMNNDITTLILASQRIFEQWNDVVSDSLQKGCMDKIQRDWNNYQNEMDVRMRIYMHAEKEIDAEFSRFESKYGR